MIRSIRVTLTLWYVGILTAILCAFGWVFYTRVEFHLYRNVDERLVSQADNIAETIYAFWQAEWQVRHKSTLAGQERRLTLLPRVLQREIAKGRFEPLIYRWATETKILETAGRPFRIILPKGKVVISHTGFNQIIASSSIPIVPEPQKLGATHYQTFLVSGHRVRVITRPVIENKNLLYVVQTAVSLVQEDGALKQLESWLFILIPSIVFVTSLVGWFLATMALRPVGKMITKAQNIRPARLDERVEVPQTSDELQRLAETFNDMLSRLERAFNRMRQFSAAASHELRTPLTVMKGELEVALRKPRDAQEYKRVLDTQLEAIDELVGIVEQLLALARSEEGDAAVEWRPVELGALVEEARQDWRSIAEKKNVELSFRENGKIWVRGEKGLLKRLVSNLLDNAIKHTPLGGRVTVVVEGTSRDARLIVKDTGPGIPPEELPAIFDKFFSRHPAGEQTSPSGGIGLGLGLCRWIAEAHQGRIEVSSAPGQGAAFTLFLPRYAS
ncbi:MAG: ATP-binding protein [Candidatus Omnitrophota bacterium]